jgi:hypothetical protein
MTLLFINGKQPAVTEHAKPQLPTSTGTLEPAQVFVSPKVHVSLHPLSDRVENIAPKRQSLKGDQPYGNNCNDPSRTDEML